MNFLTLKLPKFNSFSLLQHQFMDTLTANQNSITSLLAAVKEGTCLRSVKAREARLKDAEGKLLQGFTVSTDREIMVCLVFVSFSIYVKSLFISFYRASGLDSM